MDIEGSSRPSRHLSVKEAARKYGVSRTKIHRLIQEGRLTTAKDPRDARVTLVQQDELEQVLRFSPTYQRQQPQERAIYDRGAVAMTDAYRVTTGQLTDERRAQVDSLRQRIAARGGAPTDSVTLLRRAREERAQQLDRGDS